MHGIPARALAYGGNGEGQREVFQKRRLFTRLNGRGSSTGRGRGPATPHSGPESTAISTAGSIRPFRILKGKFQFVRADFFLPEDYSRRTAAQMENNATFCSWQLPPPRTYTDIAGKTVARPFFPPLYSPPFSSHFRSKFFFRLSCCLPRRTTGGIRIRGDADRLYY